MDKLGIELELAILLAMLLLGAEVFAPFEVDTPIWKKLVKWSLVIAITLTAYRWIGHWAAVLPVSFGALGLSFHWTWCRRHGIHPIRATPRRRYYQLRGWEWPDS